MQLFLEQVIDCHMDKLKHKTFGYQILHESNLVGEIPTMVASRKNMGNWQ